MCMCTCGSPCVPMNVQVRNMQREVSRDADIVVAAMISIVGSTLIFQGWRLDPLLLLCQVGGAVAAVGNCSSTHTHGGLVRVDSMCTSKCFANVMGLQ